MKQLGFITQGHSEYEEQLRELLDETGIDPHEFYGLDYFGLVPFFVLSGATVRPQAHTHGAGIHVQAVVVEIEEELEEGFYLTLPAILADAYSDEQDVHRDEDQD